jgi:GT2 family glycosyltransferase
MTSKNLLSIIIVNYNSYKYLSKCLRSIYKNNKREDFEIIIVDNASLDNSRNLIRRNFPMVKLIKNMKNEGFSKANNKAIKIATGKYVLFLNPDTIIYKNSLDFPLKYLIDNRRSGVVTCKVMLPNGDLDDACHRGFPTIWNSFCYFLGLAKIFPKSKLFNGYHLGFAEMDKIHEIDSCVGAFLMVKKEVGEKTGWFDEEYFWYGEDLDFCYRVKKSGHQIIYHPFAHILHHKGVTSGIKGDKNDQENVATKTKIIATKSRFRVMKTFIKKHYRQKYPIWLRKIVFLIIGLFEKIILFKYR